MQIKNHYIEGFNKISEKHGEVSCSHVIPRNISLERALGYTNEYIIKPKPEEHFRYNYYREILDIALKRVGFNPASNRITHLDLGCGPGLFSWVVQDYMLSMYGKNHSDIELIGYDHAKNIIRLAELFQKYLPVEYNLEAYFKIDEIQNMLKSRDFSDSDTVITFGHVLIQIKGNSEALQNFAEIVKNLFPSNSCIVVAVDAYSSNDRRLDFRNACKELWASLAEVGVNINNKHISSERSWMYAYLSQEK